MRFSPFHAGKLYIYLRFFSPNDNFYIVWLRGNVNSKSFHKPLLVLSQSCSIYKWISLLNLILTGHQLLVEGVFKPTEFTSTIDEKQYSKKSNILKTNSLLFYLVSGLEMRHYSPRRILITVHYLMTTSWFKVKYGEMKITTNTDYSMVWKVARPQPASIHSCISCLHKFWNQKSEPFMLVLIKKRSENKSALNNGGLNVRGKSGVSG